MRAVGLKTLKNRLSEYVRMVRGGETVLVTDRDEVVAELIPPRIGRATAIEDAQLVELLRTGIVSAPTHVAENPPPSWGLRLTREILSDLDGDRSDR